ncbi:MAG: response regulator [Myxococcota bacterium]
MILVVDDNAANRKLLRVLLAGEGYDVRLARDAEEALATLADARPALVLMDLGLPGMDGLELTRRIKADPATRALPVVAVTARVMQGDEERARLAGCDAYVPKPVDTRALRALVRSFVPPA